MNERNRPQHRGGGSGGPSASGRGGVQRSRGRGGQGRPQETRSGRGQRRAVGAGEGLQERTVDQQTYDGPPIADEITGRELDKSVQQQLRMLPEKLALRVARHLVAAATLIDSDPETAHRHALAARARTQRVTAVREACGETAYAAGLFKEALADFKAARRLGGSPVYLPMMADCERGLGRPQRALDLAKDPAVADLDTDGQIEMSIVASGARRDLGDTAGAVRVLEGRELRTTSHARWVARHRYAYAEALLADGRPDEAREWFERTAGADAEGLTDALERIAQLD